MSKLLMLDQQYFWEQLAYLIELTEKTKVDDICQHLHISRSRLKYLLRFLDKMNFHFDFHEFDNFLWIVPPQEKPSFEINCSLLEWMAISAHHKIAQEDNNKPYTNIVKDKWSKLEQKHNNDIYKALDVFNDLNLLDKVQPDNMSSVKENNWHHNSHENSEEIIDELEYAMLSKKVIKLSHKSGEQFSVCPYKMIYMDGKLSVVGEDIFDKCIVYYAVEDVLLDEVIDEVYNQSFSMFEIDEFITSIRNLSENEVRLVLKINTENPVNLNPLHHHLGNPYMVMNPEGETIWAATVEPCGALFDWLLQLQNNVEILDPTSFKKQFLEYCQQKLQDSKVA